MGFEYRSLYLEGIQEMMTQWEKDNKMKINEVFKLPTAAFQKKQKNFLKLVRTKLEEVRKTKNPTLGDCFRRMDDLQRRGFAGAEAKMLESKLASFITGRVAVMGEENAKVVLEEFKKKGQNPALQAMIQGN